MATASAFESPWQSSPGVRALAVHLRQRSYIFPWSLFLFAEGNDAEVRAVFHTHTVVVQGSGLTALLSDLALQNVSQLTEPDRTAKFAKGPGPLITALSVADNE